MNANAEIYHFNSEENNDVDSTGNTLFYFTNLINNGNKMLNNMFHFSKI